MTKKNANAALVYSFLYKIVQVRRDFKALTSTCFLCSKHVINPASLIELLLIEVANYTTLMPETNQKLVFSVITVCFFCDCDLIITWPAKQTAWGATTPFISLAVSSLHISVWCCAFEKLSFASWIQPADGINLHFPYQYTMQKRWKYSQNNLHII